MVSKAVCLISGGVDSCVSAFIAKNEGYDMFALSFNYGQRHKKEIKCAKKIARAIKAKGHVVFDIDLKRFGGSSLTDDFSAPTTDHKINEIGKSIPSTYVPARNTVFLSIGLAYAEAVDADMIYIGATAMDYAGYPDCRPEYIESFQKMADLATRRGVEGNPVMIKAPLLHMKKSDIIKKGYELGVPFEQTWSCYLGDEKPCGRCDSCLLRLKGFKEAGFKDSLEYSFLPDWYK